MVRKWIRDKAIILAAMLIAAALFAAVGCGGSGKTSTQDIWDDNGDGTAWDTETPDPAGNETWETADGAIYMCGRSVLAGWFEYWGWDYNPDDPVRFDGYTLMYQEMDVPPEIVYSAEEVAEQLARQGGGCMFFKLCFADFEGGDEYTARENLENNERMIREVVESAVDDGGLTLILGNALPVVREYADRWMVWNQREFNAFIDGLEGEYGGSVLVLDLYGTLSSPEGWLRPEYAVDPYDSHLNDAAYSALDETFRKTLEDLPASP